MIVIKDQDAILEYRKRRQERVNGKRLDDDWITIKGTHVMVDDEGSITTGPEKLRGTGSAKAPKGELKVGSAMSPKHMDYSYEEGDTEEDFTHKNIKKLKPIYDENGIEACHDEWYKFRLANSTENIHEISKDEADEVMYDNVRQSLYDGWFRNADSSYKPVLTDLMLGSQEMRNAGLNLAYENYKHNAEEPLSFEEFLTTPIKMYRGEKGQKHVEDDVFDAYTFDKDMAEHFAGSDGTITTAEIRPIDTYGSMRAVGEAEIWVPRQLSPVGYKHEDREDGWYEPIKWALEDYREVEDDSEEYDSIIREAEMIKLFADNGEETGIKILGRCIDSIQKIVLQLSAKNKEVNTDGVFFEGELNSNLGERNVLYPEVEAFKERRRKRMDAKGEDLEWITVNGAHIPIDDEGDLKGKVGNVVENHVKKAKAHLIEAGASTSDDDFKREGFHKNEEGNWVESSEKKVPVTKRRANQKLNEISDSDGSDEEKVEAISKEFNGFRNGTKIVMPDSWDSDDGKKQKYTYNADLGVWEDDNGWGSLSKEDMAYYFLDKDPNERPKIHSVPRDPDSVEESRKKREESKDYAMNPDGSINGKYTKDFHNEHVSQEERDAFSKEIKEMVDYEKGWDSERSLYRGEANRVGDKISDEIKRRAALRKGDKENSPINGQPQVEDIYDVLKDMRDFGMPEGFDPKVNSDLPKERTDAIIKEAFDRFPTDWLRDAKSKPVINIIDGPGRAICLNEGYINVYTQKDIGLKSGELTTLNDRAIVNDLAHELGHYIEWTNQKVQYSARDCLWERGKNSEIIEVEPGYSGYKDSFFSPYMGKIYDHGGTEIISMLMGNIGCFQPFSVLEGHEYDYAKGKYDGRKKKDKESLGYILGVLAGL